MRRLWALCMLVLLMVSAATAQATTVTSVVDSTWATAPRWRDAFFTTPAVTNIQASLGWTTTSANLDMFLFRQRSDGSWANVAWANSTTRRPETLTYVKAPAG